MKKIICLYILVSLCVCFLLPVKAQTVVASGTCGDNATWKLEDGTLTISGTGRIDIDRLDPWPNVKNTATQIVIEEGITYLCSYAFAEFSEVKEVVLPESVSAIGHWAFYGCTKLERINLPDKIKEIGPTCFADTALTEVILPKGITRIEGGTFLNCINLTKVICQNETIQVDGNAFMGCINLTQIILQGGGITQIGTNAFNGCINLQDIPLDEDLYYIPRGAFMGCTSLRELTLPDGVGYLYDNAFAFSGLERITLGKNVFDIDADAFKDCSSLKFIKVDGENPYFHNDDNGALYNTRNLTLLHVPQAFSGEFTVKTGTKYIGAYAAANCMSLTSLVMPNSLKGIKNNAFSGCRNLESVAFSENINYIDNGAFFGCTSLKAIGFPQCIQLIGSLAFANCKNIKDITFYGLTGIEGDAFLNVTAVAYYPSYLREWEDRLEDYGGQLTWEPYHCNHIVVTHPTEESTCTETGRTEYSFCTLCGTILQRAETIPATGHTFGEWEIVDSSAEGVLVERSCETCGHTEQKLLEESYPPQTDPSDAPTNPEDMPTEPSDTPTEPVDTPTAPTQVPTDAPAEPTQPDITIKGEPKDFPWAVVVIGVLAVAAVAAGFLLGRKRK